MAKGIRERLQGQNLSFTEIAKIVGEQWQEPNSKDRAEFEAVAQQMKEEYYAKLNAYKGTPQWREYQEYLAEFKANAEKNARGA